MMCRFRIVIHGIARKGITVDHYGETKHFKQGSIVFGQMTYSKAATLNDAIDEAREMWKGLNWNPNLQKHLMIKEWQRGPVTLFEVKK